MAKSSRTAAVLGFFFGPFGLLYIGGGHCLGAFAVVILLAVMTGGVGFLLAPFVCAGWGYAVIGAREENLAAKSVPPPVPPRPERGQSSQQQQPSPPVPAVVAAPPTAPALVTSTADAQHLAHGIVADVELYARDLLIAAMQNNEEPTNAIREELQEARTRFLARISPDLGTGVLLFQRAVRD